MQGEVMPGFDGVIQQRYPELEKIDHVHHAGNSSGIVDGAAGVLIGSKEMGAALGLKPRAKRFGQKACWRYGRRPRIGSSPAVSAGQASPSRRTKSAPTGGQQDGEAHLRWAASASGDVA